MRGFLLPLRFPAAHTLPANAGAPRTGESCLS